MRNCKEMTELISTSLERPLKLSEKMEKKFHTMMCDACRSYEKNVLTLRDITQAHNCQSSDSQTIDKTQDDTENKNTEQ